MEMAPPWPLALSPLMTHVTVRWEENGQYPAGHVVRPGTAPEAGKPGKSYKAGMTGAVVTTSSASRVPPGEMMIRPRGGVFMSAPAGTPSPAYRSKMSAKAWGESRERAASFARSSSGGGFAAGG